MNIPIFTQPSDSHWETAPVTVILESLIIGGLGGGVVAFFRFVLNQASFWREQLYQFLDGSPWYGTALLVLGFTGIGVFLGWSVRVFPLIRGGGIPQIRECLAGTVRFNWQRELPLKLITSTVGMGAGLSLGREGPAVQIGAYTGLGILSIFPQPPAARNILIIAGSAAGISAAFNAPIAGVLFVLEKLCTTFSPLLIACTMGASMAADAVAGLCCGPGPVLGFRPIPVLGIQHVFQVMALGTLAGVLGDVFSRGLGVFAKLYEWLHIPLIWRPVGALLATIPLGFLLPEVLGDGHELIMVVSGNAPPGLRRLVVLLALKISMTLFCAGCLTAGGIFLPILSCGALTGALMGRLFLIDETLIPTEFLNMVVLGMAGFFTGALQAPLTGMLLILEICGNFNHFGGLVLVCLSAHTAAMTLRHWHSGGE